MNASRGVVVRIPTDPDTGNRKGFLFIKPEDGGDDVFAHKSGLQQTTKSFHDIVIGDKVEFTEIAGEKGPRAIEVRVL